MTFRDFLKEEMTSGDIATATAKMVDMKRRSTKDKNMRKCKDDKNGDCKGKDTKKMMKDNNE